MAVDRVDSPACRLNQAKAIGALPNLANYSLSDPARAERGRYISVGATGRRNSARD